MYGLDPNAFELARLNLPGGFIESNRVRSISPLRLGSYTSLFVPRAGSYLAGNSLRDPTTCGMPRLHQGDETLKEPSAVLIWESDKDTIQRVYGVQILRTAHVKHRCSAQSWWLQRSTRKKLNIVKRDGKGG